MKEKVFVLVLGYKDLKNIKECLDSLQKQNYPNYQILFADNNSQDGSVELAKNKFSKVETYQFKENSGYAGGNNILLKKAFKRGADFCLVLNADVRVDRKLISNLIQSYKEKNTKNKVGLIQPRIMMYDSPKQINSTGNEIHYMGFGYCGNYLSTKIPYKDKKIWSVSGTAMLISREYYQEVGVLDEEFFMYNEDQNYSWRGLMKGYNHYLSVKGTVWHKYSFSKNKNKMYHSEKNRLMMLFRNYELKTLLLLIPSILVTEIFMWGFFILHGWMSSKIRSYKYIFSHIDEIKKARSLTLQNKVRSDKELLKIFKYKLDFSEVDNILVRYVVNPAYFILYKLLRLII